jgi:hypothetical protein
MRVEQNRRKIDTLYILGAGASKALTDRVPRSGSYSRKTCPVDRDFISCIGSQQRTKGWQSRTFELVKRAWLDASKFTDQGLESAILRRVGDYNLLSKIHPRRTRNQQSNENFLNNFSHLIADYLAGCHANAAKRDRAFVNKVFPAASPVSSYNNRIITFNYDLVIDRPLLERIPERKLYFDRLVDHARNGTARTAAQKFSEPLLLKLHGSINWRCERSYFDGIVMGTVDPSVKIPIWISNGHCPSPADDESPLIIPPVPEKPITRASIFSFLWTQAFEYLHEARRIVLVGYSCPATDTLAQAMFCHFRARCAEEVVIVDPNPQIITRYREMLKPGLPATTRWTYFDDFATFIDNDNS